MEKKYNPSLWQKLRGDTRNPTKERKINTILITIGVVFVLTASAIMIWDQQSASAPFVKGIDPTSAYEILYNITKGEAIPIDVRIEWDYNFQGNYSLNGSFRCPLNGSVGMPIEDVNLTNWGERMNKGFYKDQTYVLYCAQGNDSSKIAAIKMGELGFKYVYYLVGGFLRWKLENYSYARSNIHGDTTIF